MASVDMVVFCTLSPDVRLERLREREAERYGARIEPGGDRATGFAEFLTWASGYDDPNFQGRSLVFHEEWLASLECPVLRVDTARSVDDLLAEIVES